MKKIISLFLLIVSFLIFSFGCSSKKDISAEQTAQALYNLHIHYNGKESKKMGLTDDEINNILERQKLNEISIINSNFLDAGFPITDEELENLYKSQQEALKKLKAVISIESESEDEVILKLSTNYIDILTIDNKAALDTIAEADYAANTGNELSNAEFSKLYIEKLNENLKLTKPSSEMLEATFKFTKKKYLIDEKAVDIWSPENLEAFIQKILNMSVGVDY